MNLVTTIFGGRNRKYHIRLILIDVIFNVKLSVQREVTTTEIKKMVDVVETLHGYTALDSRQEAVKTQ